MNAVTRLRAAIPLREAHAGSAHPEPPRLDRGPKRFRVRLLYQPLTGCSEQFLGTPWERRPTAPTTPGRTHPPTRRDRHDRGHLLPVALNARALADMSHGISNARVGNTLGLRLEFEARRT